MNTIIFMGVFWSIYGVLGLFGIQIIPSKYKGKNWTKSYTRCCGVSWMLLGFPWLVFALVTHSMSIDYFIVVIVLITLSIPSLVYTLAYDRKYKTMWNNHQE